MGKVNIRIHRKSYKYGQESPTQKKKEKEGNEKQRKQNISRDRQNNTRYQRRSHRKNKKKEPQKIEQENVRRESQDWNKWETKDQEAELPKQNPLTRYSILNPRKQRRDSERHQANHTILSTTSSWKQRKGKEREAKRSSTLGLGSTFRVGASCEFSAFTVHNLRQASTKLTDLPNGKTYNLTLRKPN